MVPPISESVLPDMVEPTKLSDADIEKADKKDLLQALQDVASLSFLQAQKLSGVLKCNVMAVLFSDVMAGIRQVASAPLRRKQAKTKLLPHITNVLKRKFSPLLNNVKQIGLRKNWK
jgi:hypothetical protein